MSTTEYPKTRKAANAVSRDKKALAEALYVEIPPQGPGRKKAESDIENVMTELERVQELLAEDGHEISVGTLANYRRTAGWVAGNQKDFLSINWRSVSYSLHEEAYTAGRSLRQFDTFIAKCEKDGTKATVNALRLSIGKPSMGRKDDLPSAIDLARATDEEKLTAFREIAKDEALVSAAIKDQDTRVDLVMPINREYRQQSKDSQTKRELQEIQDLGEVFSAVWSRANLCETMMKIVRQTEHVTGLVAKHLDVETMDAEFKDELLRWTTRAEDAALTLRQVLEGNTVTDEKIEEWLAGEVS